MKVLFIGVGADSEYNSNCGPIFKNRRFEYIPISEDYRSIEKRTYGNERCRNDKSQRFSHYISSPSKDTKLHYDPFFDYRKNDVYTFGDPGKTRKGLSQLKKGDMAVFYAGLTPWDFEMEYNKHRYIIGYFILKRDATDFRKLIEEALDKITGIKDNLRWIGNKDYYNRKKYSRILNKLMSIKNAVNQHRKNAHIRRYLWGRDVYHLIDLVIIQGNKSSRLLNKAIIFSEFRKESNNYYLRQNVAEHLNLEDKAISRKPPLMVEEMFDTPKDFIDYLKKLDKQSNQEHMKLMNKYR